MKIIGHRGARGEAPENTIGGFRFALDRGVRHFELDLHLSADGVPVVIHDASTFRTTRRRARVEASTAAALTQMNAAVSCAWPCFEGIPSLRDALPLLEECDTVQLEIKVDRLGRQPQLLRALREVLRSCDPSRYTMTSFDRPTLQLAQTLLPGFRRGLVCKRRYIDNIALAQRMACGLLVIHYRLLSPKLVVQAQREGFEVSTYTSNDINELNKLRDWGIDSVITDFPARYVHLQEPDVLVQTERRTLQPVPVGWIPACPGMTLKSQ